MASAQDGQTNDPGLDRLRESLAQLQQLQMQRVANPQGALRAGFGPAPSDPEHLAALVLAEEYGVLRGKLSADLRADVLQRLALTELAAGRRTEAAARLVEALKSPPSDPRAAAALHYNLYRCQAESAREEPESGKKAAGHYRTAVELDAGLAEFPVRYEPMRVLYADARTTLHLVHNPGPDGEDDSESPTRGPDSFAADAARMSEDAAGAAAGSAPAAPAPEGESDTSDLDETLDARAFAAAKAAALAKVKEAADAAAGKSAPSKTAAAKPAPGKEEPPRGALLLRVLGFPPEDPSVAEMAAAEAKAVAGWRHPALAKVYEARQDGTRRPWMVMENLEGVDLERATRNLLAGGRRPTVGGAVFELKPVFSAITYLHTRSRPWLLRTLHPRDILLTRSRGLVITDFGLGDPSARCVGEDAGFVSPEVRAGRTAGPPADVYSLGRLVCFLLSGGPDLIDGLEPPIAEVLHVATHRNPENRQPTVEAFKTALGEAAGRMTRLTLTVLEGPVQTGRRYTFDRWQSFVVGRDPNADFALVQDTRASRRHVQIEVRASECRIRDLGSANGTMINGWPRAEEQLFDGDLLKLGDSVLRVQIDYPGRPRRSRSAEASKAISAGALAGAAAGKPPSSTDIPKQTPAPAASPAVAQAAPQQQPQQPPAPEAAAPQQPAPIPAGVPVAPHSSGPQPGAGHPQAMPHPVPAGQYPGAPGGYAAPPQPFVVPPGMQIVEAMPVEAEPAEPGEPAPPAFVQSPHSAAPVTPPAPAPVPAPPAPPAVPVARPVVVTPVAPAPVAPVAVPVARPVVPAARPVVVTPVVVTPAQGGAPAKPVVLTPVVVTPAQGVAPAKPVVVTPARPAAPPAAPVTPVAPVNVAPAKPVAQPAARPVIVNTVVNPSAAPAVPAAKPVVVVAPTPARVPPPAPVAVRPAVVAPVPAPVTAPPPSPVVDEHRPLTFEGEPVIPPSIVQDPVTDAVADAPPVPRSAAAAPSASGEAALIPASAITPILDEDGAGAAPAGTSSEGGPGRTSFRVADDEAEPVITPATESQIAAAITPATESQIAAAITPASESQMVAAMDRMRSSRSGELPVPGSRAGSRVTDAAPADAGADGGPIIEPAELPPEMFGEDPADPGGAPSADAGMPDPVADETAPEGDYGGPAAPAVQYGSIAESLDQLMDPDDPMAGTSIHPPPTLVDTDLADLVEPASRDFRPPTH